MPDPQHTSTSPQRVLIIEDTEERQKVLTSLYRSHAWILVNTVSRANVMIGAYVFDIISLDFNLRGNGNGADVARILNDSHNRNARVIVHSLNPRGVEEILKILPNAIAYPVSKMARTNQNLKRLRANIDEFGAAYNWT